MDYRDIQKLKVFFQALKDINFKPNLYNIPPSIRTDCLGILRKLPQFRGDEFKNDNILINTLIGYLKDPTRSKRFLEEAGFTSTQQEEFRLILEEKGAEVVSEQPTDGTTAQQPPIGEPASTMAEGGIPSSFLPPSSSTTPTRQGVVRITKPPIGGREGGTGAGTAATNKAARLAEGLASDAGIGIKKGSTRLGSAFSNFIKGLGRAGGSLLGGAIGGGGRFLGGTLLRGGYVLADIGTQMTRNPIIGISRRFLVIFLLGFMSLTFLTGFTAAPGPGGSGGPSPSPGTTPQPSPQPPIAAVASCPVPGSTISTASFDADPARGHCSRGYRGCRDECRETGRRAKAIDIRAANKDVLLPTIQGQPAQWTLINPPYSIAANDGGGWGYTFRTTYGTDTWYIDMLHLLPSSTVVKDGIYASGHIVSRVDAEALRRVGSEPHVHVTIGKNLTTPVSPGSLSTDCDAGWLPSDFMCK